MKQVKLWAIVSGLVIIGAMIWQVILMPSLYACSTPKSCDMEQLQSVQDKTMVAIDVQLIGWASLIGSGITYIALSAKQNKN